MPLILEFDYYCLEYDVRGRQDGVVKRNTEYEGILTRHSSVCITLVTCLACTGYNYKAGYCEMRSLLATFHETANCESG